MIAKAPRLYLDTALLIDLANGTWEPRYVDRLFGSVRDTGAVLVFGPGHMLDLHRGSDRATRARVFSLIDRFPAVATIKRAPLREDQRRLDAIAGRPEGEERRDWTPADLVLEECVRPILQDLERGGYEESAWMETSAQAEGLSVAGTGFRTLVGSGKLDPAALSVFETVFAMEVRGEDGVSHLMGRLPAFVRELPEVQESEARLRRLHLAASPFLATVLRPLIEQLEGTPEQFSRRSRPETSGIPVGWLAIPNGETRWLSEASRFAPGLFLRAMLIQHRNHDRNRPPKPSDNADEQHVAVVPYMDVVTTDREVFSIVRRFLGKAKTVRRARMFRNGDRAGLLGEIERLGGIGGG